MSSTKSRIRLIGAFGALAALALAVSCTGFFPGPTYSTLAIEPPTPQVPLNGTESFQVWGTDSTTGERAQITSGAYWSVTTGTTGSATITNGGLATGKGLGAITIDVSYQGLNTSASGVVYLGNITAIAVTTNITGTGTTSEEVSSASPTPVDLYAVATYTTSTGTAQQDITTSATWTVSGPSTTDVTCVNTTSPAVCTTTSQATQGDYIITVSYPQTSITGTNTIVVGP
jgi:hypothetical protein